MPTGTAKIRAWLDDVRPIPWLAILEPFLTLPMWTVG